MTHRRGVTAAIIVAALVAISAGTWGLSEWRPFEHDEPNIVWPENVQSLIDYVEDISGLEFKSAIDFEYIESTPTYNDRARDPSYEYTDDDRAQVAVDEAVGRALGLWTGDASLIESFDTLNSAAPRPVRWLATDNVMLVNARKTQPELPVSVRVDLIVYLTQALTDQNFGVLERLEDAESAQGYEALAAAYIGFALWVHDHYVDDLSRSDRGEFEADSAERSSRYAQSVDTVPATFRAIRIAFQVLGHVFATALAEDDSSLALHALNNRVPAALDQVSLPNAKYLREDSLEPVAAPPAPEGATTAYSEQLGPIRLFLMFVTGLPATEALTAADGWGNDRVTVYQLDGRVCADTHIVADSHADADRLERALNGWAFARPDEADALIGRDGVHLYASVCDPGTDVEQRVATDNEIEHYFGRADFLRQQAVDTGKPGLAECIATELFAQYTYEEIWFTLTGRDVENALLEIQDECRSTI